MTESGQVWAALLLCAAVTAVTRGLGPMTLGERELPPVAARVLVLLAPALLTALVASQVLADGARLALGADTAGAAVALLLLWRRAHVLLVVLAAAATTGLLRAAGAG